MRLGVTPGKIVRPLRVPPAHHRIINMNLTYFISPRAMLTALSEFGGWPVFRDRLTWPHKAAATELGESRLGRPGQAVRAIVAVDCNVAVGADPRAHLQISDDVMDAGTLRNQVDDGRVARHHL